MKASVKRLNQQDIGFMRALNKLFGEVFDDHNCYQSKPPSDEYLKLLLSNPKNIVLAALLDGEVVGGITAYCLSKFESEHIEIMVYDLAVSKTHQRKGIGKLLMGEIKDIGRNMGAAVVFLSADEGDEAIKFYQSLNPSEELKTRSFDFKID